MNKEVFEALRRLLPTNEIVKVFKPKDSSLYTIYYITPDLDFDFIDMIANDYLELIEIINNLKQSSVIRAIDARIFEGT